MTACRVPTRCTFFGLDVHAFWTHGRASRSRVRYWRRQPSPREALHKRPRSLVRALRWVSRYSGAPVLPRLLLGWEQWPFSPSRRDTYPQCPHAPGMVIGVVDWWSSLPFPLPSILKATGAICTLQQQPLRYGSFYPGARCSHSAAPVVASPLAASCSRAISEYLHAQRRPSTPPWKLIRRRRRRAR
jgi:hypothetical protein